MKVLVSQVGAYFDVIIRCRHDWGIWAAEGGSVWLWRCRKCGCSKEYEAAE